MGKYFTCGGYILWESVNDGEGAFKGECMACNRRYARLDVLLMVDQIRQEDEAILETMQNTIACLREALAERDRSINLLEGQNENLQRQIQHNTFRHRRIIALMEV